MGIKYRVNELFFTKWKPEMAYVLGYLYADGNLEDASYLRGKYVRVTSTDKSSIVKIKKLLGSQHKIIERVSQIVNFSFQNKQYKSSPSYLLRIGSHALYNSLTELGLYPNKSLTVKFPKIPAYFLPHFIRGYFDGDGCVYLEMGRGIKGQKIIKRLSVIFTSGSLDFLNGLQKQLKEAQKLNGRIYCGNRAYRLRYTTSEATQFFPFMYLGSNDIYLKRKFNIFKSYFNLRPKRIDEKIKSILKQEGHVAN